MAVSQNPLYVNEKVHMYTIYNIQIASSDEKEKNENPGITQSPFRKGGYSTIRAAKDPRLSYFQGM